MYSKVSDCVIVLINRPDIQYVQVMTYVPNFTSRSYLSKIATTSNEGTTLITTEEAYYVKKVYQVCSFEVVHRSAFLQPESIRLRRRSAS